MGEALSAAEHYQIASSVLSLGWQDRAAVMRLLFIEGAPGVNGLSVLCPKCWTLRFHGQPCECGGIH